MKTLLKILLFTTFAAWAATAARAGMLYDSRIHVTSATLRVGFSGTNPSDVVFTSSGAAVVQSTSATTAHKPFRVKNNAGVEILSITQGGVLSAGGAVISSGNVISSNSNSFDTPGTNQIFNSSITINGGVFGVLTQSSFTTFGQAVTETATVWSGCESQVSSLTIATNGGNVRIWLDATLNHTHASQLSNITILQNGAFINGGSATVPLKRFTQSNPAGTTVNAGINILVSPKPAAGTYTYCLGLFIDGGTNVTLNCDVHRCQFGVKEEL